MKKQKSTKRALLMSALSLLLCLSMLVGTTFAWFTDSVSSGKNRITAGNLDVELDYYTGTEWKSVQDATDLFSDKLWEPGHTEVVYLKITNAGSLAMKYQLGVKVAEETGSINVENEEFKLSDYILFGVDKDKTPSYADRAAAIKAVADSSLELNKGYSQVGTLAAGKEAYLALVVYMPTTVGNEANYLKGAPVPTIDLGVDLIATQLAVENDSYGNDYDATASVTVKPGEDLAAAIRNVEDGGIVFLENGVYNLTSGPIVIEGKKLSIVGLGNVTLNKNYGSTHIFTLQNGAEVIFKNLTMNGQGNTREGIYVRWNCKVVLEDVVIKNTGGLDIMIDEASDAETHGEETASYVTLINTDIEDVAMCASPVTSVAATQNTYVYFNYDKASTVGAIDVQSINTKPENIIINGVASTEVGKTMQLYASNDAELAAALNTIQTNSDYWNKNVFVYLAAGEYSGDYVINQYPQWNGNSGMGGSANNYGAGVPAGAPGTVITFVGEDPNTRAYVPAVKFTGNVTINGFGNAGTGFSTATAVTTFQNICFDAAKSAEANGKDRAVVYAYAAANNVEFTDCFFENATHILLGKSGSDAVGKIGFTGCTFNNGGCLSGYYETLKVMNSKVIKADNGFINKSKAGKVTVDNCDITAGKYFIRTSNSGVSVEVINKSYIEMYPVDGKADLVYFRGSDESVNFDASCMIIPGYTIAGADSNSVLKLGGKTAVASPAEVQNQLNAGNSIILSEDVNAPLSGNAIYGTPVAVIQKNGGTIDGNGHELIIQNPKYEGYAIETYGGTIKNLIISTAVGRGIVISSPKDNIYIDNVVVDGPGYAINTTEHNGKVLSVTNSTVKGWTSLAGLTSASFEKCVFGENTSKYWQNMGYDKDYDRLIRPYISTTFTDCVCEQGFYFDLSALGANCTITLKNCTVNGTVLTAENYTNFVTIELPTGRTLADCVVFG